MKLHKRNQGNYMENTPVAPAAPATPAAPVSETTPTNLNAAPAQAPAAPVANIPADKIEAFNKFIDANGGYDKAFAKLKSDVSTPAQAQPQPQAQQQLQPNAVPQKDVEVGNGPFNIPKGFVTPQEVAAQQYFMGMANEEKYAPIADEIRSGAIFKEMGKFGIQPVQNGMFNDRQIRNFLDLYSKTKPAIPTTETVTSTPTVDYVNVGEQIQSRDDALKILAQNQKLGNGIAKHPQTDAAMAFLKEYYKKK
jgi:hypothetical protein